MRNLTRIENQFDLREEKNIVPATCQVDKTSKENISA